MSWFNGRQNEKYASIRVSNPLARHEDLVVEEVGDETLIYDHRSTYAHCLSQTAATIWRACDGQTSTEALGAQTGFDAETVTLALAELESNGLLEVAPQLSNGSTRREFAVKTAKIGGVTAAAPLIYSVMAPVPAAAATPTPNQCLFYSSGDCDNCTKICGCCCCCEGCSKATSSCKVCYPTSLCNTSSSGAGLECQNATTLGNCNQGPNCTGTIRPPCPPNSKNFNSCCVPPCSVSCQDLANGNDTNCGCAGVTACS
jgi:hypothetical protein